MDHDLMIEVIRKTARKMSPAGLRPGRRDPAAEGRPERACRSARRFRLGRHQPSVRAEIGRMTYREPIDTERG